MRLNESDDESKAAGAQIICEKTKRAKLSILDVRCKDRAGTTFVVEMQLIHVPGFINRVVYNACKAYVSQLKARAKYKQLADVVAISICDFELWPDKKQVEQKLPLVPMLSRWNMTERASGSLGLLQVQYAFLELPKLSEQKPEIGGAAYWAWLFVHAPELKEMPADLPQGPYREALELANEAEFTQEERDAYQKVIDEIQQVRELAEAKWAEGNIEGRAEARAGDVLTVLRVRGIAVPDAARDRILAEKDTARLDRWLETAILASSVAEVIDEPS